MAYKTPDFWTAVIACAAPALGALARWQEQNMFDKPFHFWPFLLDMVVSVMVGVFGFWIVMDLGQPESIAAAVAAIGGNVGSRVFDIASRLLQQKVKEKIDEVDEEE